jgi:hypothetical protein
VRTVQSGGTWKRIIKVLPDIMLDRAAGDDDGEDEGDEEGRHHHNARPGGEDGTPPDSAWTGSDRHPQENGIERGVGSSFAPAEAHGGSLPGLATGGSAASAVGPKVPSAPSRSLGRSTSRSRLAALGAAISTSMTSESLLQPGAPLSRVKEEGAMSGSGSVISGSGVGVGVGGEVGKGSSSRRTSGALAAAEVLASGGAVAVIGTPSPPPPAAFPHGEALGILGAVDRARDEGVACLKSFTGSGSMPSRNTALSANDWDQVGEPRT